MNIIPGKFFFSVNDHIQQKCLVNVVQLRFIEMLKFQYAIISLYESDVRLHLIDGRQGNHLPGDGR